MKGYLRFSSLMLFYYPLSYIALLWGGVWPWLAIWAMVATQVVVDNVAPPDTSTATSGSDRLFDLYLYAHLPAGLITVLLMLWQATPGDLFGLGRLAAGVFGEGILAAHAENSWFELLGCGFLGGFIMSSNTVAAHELVHRLSNGAAVLAGRITLALNGDAQFSISHVFGHHANIGTDLDPATARRGESLYAFVIRSAVGQYREAVVLERRRLERHGRPFYSLHNQLFTGIAMSVGFAVASYAIAGWRGLGIYFISVLYAKFMFETVNYIQHYGLIRIPGTRVEPRHSWDCTNLACSNAFYMLPRHSEHHARPVLPYWKLTPGGGVSANELHLKYGYLATMLLAMVPPLWFRVTTPWLLAWDQTVATPAEGERARQANLTSGLPALVEAA